ncbi:MAG: hypothetical protein KZQ70_15780, partial [gamma proteobacterium symbiont of Lucinoma myriamae]|nr:hypothetical protein [gamma proteobacterium symbiont of Lucinoma myriamae]
SERYKYMFTFGEWSWESYLHYKNAKICEPLHEKTCFLHMRTTNAQISCASAQADQRLSFSLPR